MYVKNNSPRARRCVINLVQGPAPVCKNVIGLLCYATRHPAFKLAREEKLCSLFGLPFARKKQTKTLTPSVLCVCEIAARQMLFEEVGTRRLRYSAA